MISAVFPMRGKGKNVVSKCRVFSGSGHIFVVFNAPHGGGVDGGESVNPWMDLQF